MLRPTGPSGPRGRSSKPNLPPVSLPTDYVPVNYSNGNGTILSPSDTPRYSAPVPVLNTPKPKPRPTKVLQLDTSPGINGGIPFQNPGGPIASVAEIGSTLPGEEKTIRPDITLSPRDNVRTGALDDLRTATHAPKEYKGRDDEEHPPDSTPPSQFSNSHVASSSAEQIRTQISRMYVSKRDTKSGSVSSETSSSPSSGFSDTSLSSFESPNEPKQFSDTDVIELERLGEGAGGAVHKVKDKRTGMVYARKTITTREVSVRQVMRELSIVASTKHVNIVQCEGAYMSPSSSEVKIVMEYCEGGSLEAIGAKIKERGAIVGEKVAGRIAEGVLQGLAYLHSKKTIHRDIKPSNILLSREGIIKLCDFGVSGELIDSMVGTFTGTLLYMAPERISGKGYTVRSDVWSTGISILELVQNRFPFPSDLPPIELILHITTGEPPKLEDSDGVTWSAEMKDFIAQTIIRDPAQRPTPRDMLSHPWILHVMKQEVHMARWIRQVWQWPKDKKSKDKQSSRPATSQDSPSSVEGDSHA